MSSFPPPAGRLKIDPKGQKVQCLCFYEKSAFKFRYDFRMPLYFRSIDLGASFGSLPAPFSSFQHHCFEHINDLHCFYYPSCSRTHLAKPLHLMTLTYLTLARKKVRQLLSSPFWLQLLAWFSNEFGHRFRLKIGRPWTTIFILFLHYVLNGLPIALLTKRSHFSCCFHSVFWEPSLESSLGGPMPKCHRRGNKSVWETFSNFKGSKKQPLRPLSKGW